RDAVARERLGVAYPEARGQLDRPARLRFGEGRFAVDELALAAGAQRIVAAGSLAGRRMRARLAITALDLARLPRALVPPALALAGRLDVEAAASGSVTRPQGKARLMLRDGRFRKIDHVDLTLAASHDG